MSRFRRLVLLVLVAAAAAGALAASAWQFRRLAARRTANAAVLLGRTLPPIDLNRALTAGTSLEGRSVTARGSFRRQGEVLLRARVQMEVPGLQVVTPFVLEGGGATLWVLRGFVGSPDAFTPPPGLPAPVDSVVSIPGLILPLPVTGDSGRSLVLKSDTTWQRMDRDVFAARAPGSLPVYLHLTGDRDGPGRLVTVPLPTMDDGPHLSYALQWIGIAMAILTFGYLMVWRTPQKSLA